MSLRENLEVLWSELPRGVALVAVSKFHPASAILEAYEAGQRRFGESRVQELLEKENVLPKDIDWHFIGHLQSNKVSKLIGKVSMIESVDSERLLSLIDDFSVKASVTTNVLLQVHVAMEETKFGFYPEEIITFFRKNKYETLKAVKICGLMGMASNTDDMERVREDFRKIAQLFREIKEISPGLKEFDKLSMGMSGDWKIAVEEGSDMVRIGSAIFGSR